MSIKTKPWAKIFIDEAYVDDTPLKKPITLATGEHVIKLEHPLIPAFSTRIVVQPDMEKSLFISLIDSLKLGTLNIRAFPWANVYINGEFKDTTPLKDPVFLTSGNHIIRLENPSLQKSWQKELSIYTGENLDLNVDLKEK